MKLEGMSVLLAEDNPTNQMVAMQMLKSLGATVTLANDGEEALEILAEQMFNLALIDIEMPRVSGIELIRQLREAGEPYASLPMIALTAYVMREHRAAIDAAGADGIIAKPIVSIEQFGDEILAIMARRDTKTEERPGPVPQEEAIGNPEPADINQAVFNDLCASFTDEQLVELFGKVSTDLSDSRDTIRVAIDQADMSGLRAATHVLVSVAGAIGAERLQNLAQCLNSAGHTADKPVIERDGPELIVEASRVLAFVNGCWGGTPS